MQFDLDYYDAVEQFKEWISFTHDGDDYDCIIMADTPVHVGKFKHSDLILVYDNHSRKCLAIVERVSKKSVNMLTRWHYLNIAKHVVRNPKYGFEGYLYTKGEYIEIQMYKRWWYDMAKDIRHIQFPNSTNSNSFSGQNK